MRKWLPAVWLLFPGAEVATRLCRTRTMFGRWAPPRDSRGSVARAFPVDLRPDLSNLSFDVLKLGIVEPLANPARELLACQPDVPLPLPQLHHAPSKAVGDRRKDREGPRGQCTAETLPAAVFEIETSTVRGGFGRRLRQDAQARDSRRIHESDLPFERDS